MDTPAYTTDILYIGNGPVQRLTEEESIRRKWVKEVIHIKPQSRNTALPRHGKKLV